MWRTRLKKGNFIRLKTVQHLAAQAAGKKKEKRTKTEDIRVWHQRLGHLGEQNIRKLQGMAEGIRVDPKSTLGICEDCQSGKQTRQPNHDPAKNKAKEVLGRIFSDNCRSPSVKSYI